MQDSSDQEGDWNSIAYGGAVGSESLSAWSSRRVGSFLIVDGNGPTGQKRRISSGSRFSARFFCASRLADNPTFHPLGKLAQRSLQHVGNFPQTAHRRIDDASFHAANIRPIETALVA